MLQRKRACTVWYAVVLAFGMDLAPAWGAAPADWQPVLVAPPAGGVRGPTEPIRITLPRGIDAQTLERLSLELDAVDVTALVTLVGDDAVLVPPQPLAWGEHRLRLIESATDGSLVERGVWVFEVRRSALLREAGLEAQATVNASQRVLDEDLGPLPGTDRRPGRTQANGSARLQAAIADAGWRAAGVADFLYASEASLLGGNREVDLGEFLLTASAGPVALNAGHHALGPDSLVMQGFNRRGVSGGLTIAPIESALTGFTMRTEPITGFRDGLGVTDSRHRVDGVLLSSRPLRADPISVALSGVYLTGEGTDQVGAGVGGDPAATSGDAFSLAADTLLAGGFLRLRGEYAGTRFDFDGPEPDLGGKDDHAYTLLAVVTPWRDRPVLGRPLGFHVGLEHARIGTFFRSPAAPGQPSDRESVRGFTGLTWAGLGLQLSGGREESNVNDLDLLPRLRSDQGAAAITYTPSPRAGAGGEPRRPWFGQPSYTAALQYVRQETVDRPAAFAGTPADLRTRLLQLGASFAYESWDWSITQGLGWQDDFSDASPDTRTITTELAANVRAGTRLTLAPRVQRNETDLFDTRARSLGYLAGLGVQALLIPEKLSSTVGYEVSRETASDDSVHKLTRSVNAGVTWQLVAARGRLPGLQIWTQGIYVDVEDEVESAATSDTYQVLLGATLGWQATF